MNAIQQQAVHFVPTLEVLSLGRMKMGMVITCIIHPVCVPKSAGMACKCSCFSTKGSTILRPNSIFGNFIGIRPKPGHCELYIGRLFLFINIVSSAMEQCVCSKLPFLRSANNVSSVLQINWILYLILNKQSTDFTVYGKVRPILLFVFHSTDLSSSAGFICLCRFLSCCQVIC